MSLPAAADLEAIRLLSTAVSAISISKVLRAVIPWRRRLKYILAAVS
jgi:hypothetical protein